MAAYRRTGSPPRRWEEPLNPERDFTTIAFSPPKKRAPGSLKGKEKALDDDTWPGEITYRHLYATGIAGTSNPLRAIAHIDIDAAYAAMEMSRMKIPPDVPLAVQQWDGLIAVNYPARKYGITRMESPAEALKKCPHLILRHCQSYRVGDTEPADWPDAKPATHKISLDFYRRESLRIIKVFQGYCPVVEKASIDESFLDLTDPIRERIMEHFPSLAKLPLGASLDSSLPPPESLGVVLDWSQVGNVVPAAEGNEKEADRPTLSQDGSRLTWSDVGLYYAAEIVHKCRKQVHDELGYTCSAGIAPNKMLAKLCSGWKKPNAQTVLRFSAVGGFLRPMAFQKIRNLGGKLGEAVKFAFGVETIGELLPVSAADMQSKLGEESGMWVWEIIRGLDMSEVEAKSAVKSMISSKNFRPSISNYGEATHWIHIFCTELLLRLTEAREASPTLWPKTICLHVRSEGFVIRSHQIPFPFTSHLSIPYIEKYSTKLVRAAIGEKDKYEDTTFLGPWSNLQLSLTGLERLEKGQEGLHRFLAASAPKVAPSFKRSNSSSKSDEAKAPPLKRSKSSSPTLVFQPVAPAVKKARTADPRPAAASVASLPKEKKGSAAPPPPTSKPTAKKSKQSSATFKCPRCREPISIADDSSEGLQKAKDEHQDYHFARDMLEKERRDEREPARSILEAPPKPVATSGKVKVKVTKAGGSERAGQQSLSGFFSKR